MGIIYAVVHQLQKDVAERLSWGMLLLPSLSAVSLWEIRFANPTNQVSRLRWNKLNAAEFPLDNSILQLGA